MVKFARRMSTLRQEGAIGLFQKCLELQKQGKDIINMGIGQPDFSPPQFAIDAAIENLRHGPHGYSEPGGIFELRSAIVNYLNHQYDVEVEADQVLAVPGGKQVLQDVVMLLGDEETEVLYPDPGFPSYKTLIEFSGAKPIAYPLTAENNFSPKAEEVLALITPRTRLIILNSPSNPTGGIISKTQMDELVAGLESHPEVAILSDEIYSRLLYDNQSHISLLQYPQLQDRAIVMDGFSKTYAMTGWRMGYAVWPKQWIETGKRIITNGHTCNNMSAQYGAIGALQGDQSEIDRMKITYESRRDVLVRGLNQIGLECAMPGGAFYAFPSIASTGLSSDEFAGRLLDEKGVAAMSGKDYGENGEGFIRLSYACSTKTIENALEKIDLFVNGPSILF